MSTLPLPQQDISSPGKKKGKVESSRFRIFQEVKKSSGIFKSTENKVMSPTSLNLSFKLCQVVFNNNGNTLKNKVIITRTAFRIVKIATSYKK